MQTKNAVLRTKRLEGANILVDRVMMKIDLRPKRLEIVFKIMVELEYLQDILEKINERQHATEVIHKHLPGIYMCVWATFSLFL